MESLCKKQGLCFFADHIITNRDRSDEQPGWFCYYLSLMR